MRLFVVIFKQCGKYVKKSGQYNSKHSLVMRIRDQDYDITVFNLQHLK